MKKRMMEVPKLQPNKTKEVFEDKTLEEQRFRRRIEITVTNNRLRLAKLNKNKLIECMHSICHLLFFIEM
jgi:hypothetical protein